MFQSVVFQPEVAWPVLWALVALSVLVIAVAVIRGLPGWWLRAFAAIALLLALANPALKTEERDPLSDIVLIVVDDTASQGLTPRPEQVETALAELLAEIGAERDAIETETVRVDDPTGVDADRGTLLMTALAKAATNHAADRLAGAILISDGRVDDPNVLTEFPAPVHLLLTGTSNEWDRRLIVKTAPAFGILGEPVAITLRIDASGQVPQSAANAVPMSVSIDGGEPITLQMPVGEDVTISLELDHGGPNVIQMIVPTADGELTDRNNAAVVSINGVRDRLRVLLVSGEPHAGERTWRNLLKSDPAVDLVHFTILRPPHKQDGVPVYELSLIAFPTRELFMEKIDDFDLIIFDRYRRRGVLPDAYIQNIVRYVEEGGALLVASGPSFAGAQSLYRTPLEFILPVAPTAVVVEEPFVPLISDLGQRHPVTEGLEEFAPNPPVDGIPGWGRWFRLIDTISVGGHVVMDGAEGRPLLTLDRPGEGRIAVLSSDHAWLWSRGYEGGGPQLELLRRLAHWLMKEPELEEEVLSAVSADGQIVLTRRSMAEDVGDVVLTAPDGSETVLALEEVAPGRFSASVPAGENGLYRLREGDETAVVAVGPAAPKEFETPISTAAILSPIVQTTNGGVFRLEDGFPDIRRVSEDRVAAGRGWIGLSRREAYNVTDIRLTPLAPAWLMLMLSALFAIAAWRIEGR